MIQMLALIDIKYFYDLVKMILNCFRYTFLNRLILVMYNLFRNKYFIFSSFNYVSLYTYTYVKT